MRISIREISCFLATVFVASTGYSQEPLSAIDWLNDAAALPDNLVLTPLDEADAASSVQLEEIVVTSLDAVSPDATGLLPSSVTGLPRDLWGSSSSTELAALFHALPADLIPALQAFVRTLLLAELDPPADSDPEGKLLLARIDTLIRFGAVDEAQALLERAGTGTPERFQRWLDLSLLTGTEAKACEMLRARPELSQSIMNRVFCLARGRDWSAAALTLETASILGDLSPQDRELLTRFLADDFEEPDGRLPTPRNPTPLHFRLHEAAGEPLATTGLPISFAHADLDDSAGWKARIEAAERLARQGALSENMLLGLYTERLPAASGGVWDRVSAIQALDDALTDGASDEVAQSLPDAWQAMAEAELEVPFAEIYAERLARHSLAGNASKLAFQLMLLSHGYESLTADVEPRDPEERFLKAVSRGDVSGTVPQSGTQSAVADGFLSVSAEGPLADAATAGNLGAALLSATELLNNGAAGDIRKLTEAIAFFRSVGLEDLTRRAALQALILDRRG